MTTIRTEWIEFVAHIGLACIRRYKSSQLSVDVKRLDN